VANTVDPLRIVTVCTHNRTRSVMMAALIGTMLHERVGPAAAVVRSAGFGPPDLPAISEAVDAMRRRGLDVSGHRSRQANAEILQSAALILTAERDHVIRIVSIDPTGFRRTMTLPEFLALASRADDSHDGDVREWVQGLTADRTPVDFLRDPIGEIDDPTGLSGRAFESAVVALEAQCSMAATLLARVLDGTR
jgi:protein-tyrosine-phosphatase